MVRPLPDLQQKKTFEDSNSIKDSESASSISGVSEADQDDAEDLDQ